jgi:histidinol dehydrogenase
LPKVDKIVGPGNIYVAMAKKMMYGYCDIDAIAGPSEIMVVADETANPKYVAADLLSQAEHDMLASAILVTTSEKLALEVQSEVGRQTEYLSRKEIINKSIEDYSAIVITESIDKAVELVNKVAPEHLELCIEEPFSLLSSIRNAGAIFLGHFASEPLGDYFAGPNHVLPTSGTARFFSPLNVGDFMKKSSVISYTKKALAAVKDDVIRLAEAEGLTAHANAIKVRFE